MVPLLTTAQRANREWSDIKRQPITYVQPGDVAFVSLQFFGDLWYQELALPQWDEVDYVVKMIFGQFRNKNHRHIRMYCESLDEHLTDWDNGDVLRWGLTL